MARVGTAGLLRVLVLTALAGALAAAPVQAAKSSVVRGPRGLLGPRGLQGPRGIEGRNGAAGADAVPVISQDVEIDWQNGQSAGHDAVRFVVPGVGSGVVKCSQDTQWVRFFPSDLGSDTEMWAVTMTGNKIVTLRAGHSSPDYGPDYNIGLNSYSGQQESQGSIIGLISERGPFGSPGAMMPPPGAFRLNWYWKFDDSYGPRCYVSGSVTVKG